MGCFQRYPPSFVQRLLTDDTVSRRPDVSSVTVREISKNLFGGGRYRIEIGAAISDANGIANVSDLADQLGVSRQTVSNELAILRHAGLLSELGPRRERRAYFRAHDSPYWQFCVRCRADAAEMILRNRVA